MIKIKRHSWYFQWFLKGAYCYCRDLRAQILTVIKTANDNANNGQVCINIKVLHPEMTS